MADLTATLLGCQNPDPSVRTAAEQALQNAENTNLPEFCLALVTELSTEGKDLAARQLAGLHFKNLLVAKDEALQTARHDKWKAMDPAARASVKTCLLASLRSPETAPRHTAAQACAEVAAVELPYNEWQEFLATLMENVTSNDQPDGVKISSLECLGFTCERLAVIDNAPDIAPDTTDRMLTTIVDGIRNDRPDAIRFAAATALRNSLLFTRKNMENENERNMIMQTICEATQSADSRVRGAAYECISQITFQYYDKLQPYMQTLFQLTFNTIKNDEESVALQAIEFWSTLCDEEMELIDEAAECAERGIPVESGRECVRYVAAALEHLVPLLTETLTKQDEDADVDEDTWNLSMAGATCLSLVANTVEDLVVPVIMPFVQSNIQSDNWRLREAAIMAFSSVLEGPSMEIIGPYVNQSIPVLLNALSDPHVLVKDTTAWAIGRICELHVRAIPEETFPQLVNVLMSKLLSETPRVSSQASFALHNLAAAFAGDEAAAASGTNALSAYMPALLQTLLQVTDRKDADESNLRVAAFEAVSVLIQNSAPDCKPLLLQLLPVIIGRLSQSFSLPVLTNEDREQKEGLQGLLCGLIQVITLKVTKEDIMPHADSIMTNLLQVLQTKNATCHEEAFSATSAIADQMEADFEKYLLALQPFLMMGLQNFEAYHVCTIAVGLVGDIARSVEAKIQPFCDEIMSALMQSLQNQSLHRSVKPPVLSCFGDIAMAIGAAFEPYLQVSLMMLLQASQTRAPDDDEELIEYVNSLREGILEAYTGIIQGLKDGDRVEVLVPYVDAIMTFLEVLSVDETRDYEVLGKACGLVGDFASTMGGRIRDQMSRPFVAKLLREGHESGDETIIDTCTWANGVVAQILQQP
uniref:Importin N-terminal domain-containing protein n=1 Tax=Ditylum brightwellii TaxID=49249 RepID=A0A6U3SM86_9STRA|mmetsp:Transcript_31266/g.46632  ORF Transcript_31266/g.46632 Transcript_31266/m.46632 type:complete len:872 (+) Transcript_31266:49-2664(+)